MLGHASHALSRPSRPAQLVELATSGLNMQRVNPLAPTNQSSGNGAGRLDWSHVNH
jgi:hypothetical protein